jgi:hypothetical protein
MSSDFEIDATCGGGPSTGSAAGLNHHNQQWNALAEDAGRATGSRASSSAQRCSCCTRCWTAGCTWLTSAVGVSILLLAYLIIGAVMFMILGNQDVHPNPKSAGQQQPQPQQAAGRAMAVHPHHPHHQQEQLQYADPDGRLLEKTLATVDRLWSITEDLNILYRDNWTHLARVEMRHYQDQIVRTLRQMMLEDRYSFRQTWTFPMSLLYALTLITTIGKAGHLFIIDRRFIFSELLGRSALVSMLIPQQGILLRNVCTPAEWICFIFCFGLGHRGRATYVQRR